MSNQDIQPALMSILTEHVNAYGKVEPAELCKDIAAYINMLPFGIYFWDSLSDFIHAYGEEADDCYLGRDEYGEKQYILHNPNTEWHGRITRELRAIGYYARYDAWAKEQKAA